MSTGAPISGLYVVTSEYPHLKRSHVGVARAALEAGAKVIQYRDKTRKGSDLLAVASELRALCRAAGVAFVMNDHAEVAMKVRADGLHLGQGDLAELSGWRPRWSAFLGISAWSVELAEKARSLGADYVGSGPVRPTVSKPMTREPLGLDGLRAICETGVPVAAIGGLGADDVRSVFAAGASAICVMGGIGAADDPLGVAREIVSRVEETGAY
ncbi:MAG: thiamine phosphate synthase [Actinobacteria bacterium]|nr:thiamine phosphate synthase [Actinomycetota bacterium]